MLILSPLTQPLFGLVFIATGHPLLLKSQLPQTVPLADAHHTANQTTKAESFSHGDIIS